MGRILQVEKPSEFGALEETEQSDLELEDTRKLELDKRKNLGIAKWSDCEQLVAVEQNLVNKLHPFLTHT